LLLGKLSCSDLEDSCHRRLQCLYIGTLETLIEERETIRETETYQGGNIDGKDTAPELGVWELDLRSDQFPVLFISHKETRTKVPRSEIVEKCTGMHNSIMEWRTVYGSFLTKIVSAALKTLMLMKTHV
jgi:hypothetical protein